MRPHVLIGVAFLYLCTANILWVFSDTRPPFYDMAYHQTKAIAVYEAAHNNNFASGFRLIPRLTGFYPPLFHIVVALFYALFGISSRVGILSNLPAIAILLVSTYAIGRRLLPPMTAAAGAVLACFYPMLVWISRETLPDYWLTGLVALAMWLLFRTESFSKKTESVIFGIVCGLGMLTKWTFVFFLALPVLWAARNNWRNATISTAIASMVSAYWYLSRWRLQSLVNLYSINSADSVAEGDPARFSLQALVFYVRALEGSQLFLLLFVLFVVGSIFLARRFNSLWIPIVLWVIGGWGSLLLFNNKDPRYILPLLPALALISATVFYKQRFWIPILLAYLIFQHYLVSFGIQKLPERVVLLRGIGGRIPWDWNLYSQTYFQVWGPPSREDWKIMRVLSRITSTQKASVRLGIIPSIPRFDPDAFEFYIALHKYPVTISRLRQFDERMLVNQDYVLMSESDQGYAYSSDLGHMNQNILDRPDNFKMIDRFMIPSGQFVRLYKTASP
jgi:4-amino-4-deoxy-L-arabinose transferase-like glycosyltransferase